MVVIFDETLTGGEMLMSLYEWVVPGRVRFEQPSDNTESRVPDIIHVRKSS